MTRNDDRDGIATAGIAHGTCAAVYTPRQFTVGDGLSSGYSAELFPDTTLKRSSRQIQWQGKILLRVIEITLKLGNDLP